MRPRKADGGITMDVKDLMIGDLVTFKECQNDENLMPIEIVALSYQQGGGRESSLVSINGDNACDIFDIDDEIVGIPLSPEILEKNGFEARWYEKLVLEADEYCFSLQKGVDGTNAWWWEMFSSPIIPINYVHELQHVLKLCGIDKEIKL